MFNLIICFSEIRKIFVCVHVMQVAFLSEDWKKLFPWCSILFTVFALEMRKREVYRKETR